MENPNKIEIEGLKTIHKLCNFGAEHDMEGCSFTEIVERMFSKIKSMQTQVNTLDEMLLNQGDALAEAKAQAVPEGFVLVPERNVHDHYIANHLKGTTCSVDVSELTSNDGDRIYGKLRSFDCLGSDGNTLIYDLESSNFNLVKTTGNTGDFVLVEKTKLMQIIGSAAIIEPITRGNPLMSKYKTELEFILSTVRAMIEAQEQSHENG